MVFQAARVGELLTWNWRLDGEMLGDGFRRAVVRRRRKALSDGGVRRRRKGAQPLHAKKGAGTTRLIRLIAGQRIDPTHVTCGETLPRAPAGGAARLELS